MFREMTTEHSSAASALKRNCQIEAPTNYNISRYFGKNDQQTFGTAIQIDGNRFEGPMENTYSLHILTANYRYNFLSREKLQLSVAPGALLGYANIDTEIESAEFSTSETHPGIGLKLGATLALKNDLSLLADFAFYDIKASDYFTTSGVSLAYDRNPNTRITLGTSLLSLSDGSSSNRDKCVSVTDIETRDCKDSKIDILSTGLHIGVQYRK